MKDRIKTLELLPVGPDGRPPAGVTAPPAIAEMFAATKSLYEREGYALPWTTYVGRHEGAVVGIGAFKSPPKNGRVEIAYMTIAEMEGRGVATAMARALVAIALASDPALVVFAQTLPQENPSTSVLRRLGFVRGADVLHPEDGPVWEWFFRNR